MVPSASAALSATVSMIHLLGVAFGRRGAGRDAPNLSRVLMDGRSFTCNDGRTYRPSVVTAANGMVRRPTLCGDPARGTDKVASHPRRGCWLRDQYRSLLSTWIGFPAIGPESAWVQCRSCGRWVAYFMTQPIDRGRRHIRDLTQTDAREALLARLEGPGPVR